MNSLDTVKKKHLKFKKTLFKIIQKLEDRSSVDISVGWNKACSKSFKLFVYRFCLHLFWGEPGVLHDDFFDIADFMGSLSDSKGNRSKQVKENIIAPRGNAKSTLAVICFVVWQVIFKREKLILLVTNNATKAKENLKNIRYLLESDNIQAVFKPLIEKANTDEILCNGCQIISRSINQDVRGINKEGTRLTLCIGDDIESEEMGNSPTMRESNYRTWVDAIEPAATPATFPIQTCFILVNTALHPECLVMKLKDAGSYNNRIYPAVIKEPTNSELWNQFDFLVRDTQTEIDRFKRIESALEFYNKNKKKMDEGLEINWPSGEPYWSLRIFRLEKGQTSFNREKQGNPINPDKLKFAQYMLEDGKIRDSILFKIEGRTIKWGSREFDLFKMKRWGFFDGAVGRDYASGCYASFTIVAHQSTPSERIGNSVLSISTGLDFVLDNMLMRERDEKQAEKILILAQRWHLSYICIEATVFQGMYSTILRKVAKELRDKGILYPDFNPTIMPLTALAQKERTGKLDAIDNVLTSLGFAPNTLLFNSSLSGEFMNQIIQFPTAKFVDAPDSLASALHFYYLFDAKKQGDRFEKLIDRA